MSRDGAVEQLAARLGERSLPARGRTPRRLARVAGSALRAASGAPVRVELMRTLDPQSLTGHVDRLYRAAWALCGSREDAEDLVQETFARVLARPRVIRGDERGYLMKVLRNTFLNSRRSAARRPVVSASLDDVVPVDPSTRYRPEQALHARELYAAIAALPEDFRLPLVAIDVLGLSYGEAARALGAREATITTRLFRARKRIVQALASEIEPASREGSTASRVQLTETERVEREPR